MVVKKYLTTLFSLQSDRKKKLTDRNLLVMVLSLPGYTA
jgi:hypothetical protein